MSENEDEKEQKPKKAFTVVHTVWDDGEIDTEMYEFRKNPSGRGAPGKWRLGKDDFTRRIEETLGDSEQIGEVMAANTNMSETTSPKCSVVSVKVAKVPKISAEEAEMVDSPIVDVEPEKIDDGDDMEFGEFDKQK